MAAKGKGASGGARVLYLFTKGEAENISAEGKKAVQQIAEQIKREHRP